MQIRPRPIILFALLSASLVTAALAQTVSPSFFGATPATPAKAGSAAPSAPVMSKDEFLQQVTTLKANNDAQFQANLKAQLKPLPSSNTGTTPIATPPSAAPTTPAAAPMPTTAPTPPATTTGTPSGYTGFGAGTTPSTPTTSTPAKASSGWNVTY